MNGVSPVSPDSQGSRASPDLRGPSEAEERREVTGLMDFTVLKESEGPPGCQDFQERQDFQVCPGRTDRRAREALQGATGQRVKAVSQEIQEFPDSKDDRDHRVCQDKRATRAT